MCANKQGSLVRRLHVAIHKVNGHVKRVVKESLSLWECLTRCKTHVKAMLLVDVKHDHLWHYELSKTSWQVIYVLVRLLSAGRQCARDFLIQDIGPTSQVSVPHRSPSQASER